MREKAVTLIELLVVVGVLAVISASLVTATITWRRAWSIGAVEMDAQAEARRALRRIAADLMQAAAGNITITPNRPPNQPAQDSIVFRIPDSYDTATGTVVWGDQIQYALDISNSRIVRTDLGANGTEIVGSYVNGLQFDLNQQVLQITVTATRSYRGSSDIRKIVTLSSQVNLRN